MDNKRSGRIEFYGGKAMRNGSLVPLFAACFMLLICPAVAQQTTGIISGQVTDSSGAILPNVPVNLTGTASGITRRDQDHRSG